MLFSMSMHSNDCTSLNAWVVERHVGYKCTISIDCIRCLSKERLVVSVIFKRLMTFITHSEAYVLRSDDV